MKWIKSVLLAIFVAIAVIISAAILYAWPVLVFVAMFTLITCAIKITIFG